MLHNLQNCSSPDTSSCHWAFFMRNKSSLSIHNLLCNNLLSGFANIRNTKHATRWLIWWFVTPGPAMSFTKNTRYARWQIIPKFEEAARKDTHFSNRRMLVNVRWLSFQYTLKNFCCNGDKCVGEVILTSGQASTGRSNRKDYLANTLVTIATRVFECILKT